jgi:uncharacterized protein
MRSCIYEGQVSHARATPVAHAFRYRLFMLYLDLAELPTVFAGRWFWSTRRAALARFRREDHLGDPERPLDACVRELVERETGRRPDGPIRLLTHLAYYGYCFNPVSFYYCFDASGAAVQAVVAEVSNTPWGERHCYVLDSRGAPLQRFATDKLMHVSPFMPMDVRYEWRFGEPGTSLAVAMACDREGQRVFGAALALDRREITATALARALLVYPAMTFKVIAAIHWQALRLWWKRCRVYDHPKKHEEAARSA